MFFELFVFLIVIAVALVIAGSVSRRVWPLLLSCVFFVLTGSILLSEGLRVETGASWTQSTGLLVITTEALTAANSMSVSLLGNAFFYGGFLVAVVSIVFLLKGRLSKLKGGF